LILQHFFLCFNKLLGLVSPILKLKKKSNVVGMLTSLWYYWLGVDNLDKFTMIINNWLVDVWTNCPYERQSIIEFLVEEVGIIEDNDMMLDVINYLNIDYELVWWIWKLMNILLKFLKSLFALIKILLVLTLMAKCNGLFNYLFLIMHGTMSFFFNSQFKVPTKCLRHMHIFSNLLFCNKILFWLVCKDFYLRYMSMIFVMLQSYLSHCKVPAISWDFNNSWDCNVEEMAYHCTSRIRLWKLWCRIQHPTYSQLIFYVEK
jgi:hypothetical protein